MYKILIKTSLIIYLFLQLLIVKADNSVDCSSSNEFSGCNSCFDGGKVYTNTYKNNFKLNWGALPGQHQAFLASEHNGTGIINVSSNYNSGEVLVKHDSPDFLFTTTTGTNPQYRYINIEKYYVDNSLSTKRNIFKSNSGYVISFSGISDNIKRDLGSNKSLFKIEYNIKYKKNSDFSSLLTSPSNSHKVCVAYYPAWCGDGVKYDGKEDCDGTDGVPVGKRCNASCKIEDIPANSCKSTLPAGVNSITHNLVYNPTSVNQDWHDGVTSAGCYYTLKPTCNKLTLPNPTYRGQPLSFSCKGDNSISSTLYKIQTKNPSLGIWYNLGTGTTSSGTFTFNKVFNNNGNIPIRCLVGNETNATLNCSGSIDVVSPPTCIVIGNSNTTVGVSNNYSCSSGILKIYDSFDIPVDPISGITTYKFDRSGTHKAGCYIGGSSSPNCSKIINVGECDSIDGIGGTVNKGTSSNYTCNLTSGTASNYEVRIFTGSNINSPISIINNGSGYTFSNTGSYNIQCVYNTGSIVLPQGKCKKSITVKDLTIDPDCDITGPSFITQGNYGTFNCNGDLNYKLKILSGSELITEPANGSSTQFSNIGRYRAKCYDESGDELKKTDGTKCEMNFSVNGCSNLDGIVSPQTTLQNNIYTCKGNPSSGSYTVRFYTGSISNYTEINSGSGYSFTALGNYKAQCFDGGVPQIGNCIKNINVSNCTNIVKTNVGTNKYKFNCIGNGSTFGLKVIDKSNGDDKGAPLLDNDIDFMSNYGTGVYEVACTYNSVIENSCKTTVNVGVSASGTCGDGKKDSPNSSNQYEECDYEDNSHNGWKSFLDGNALGCSYNCKQPSNLEVSILPDSQSIIMGYKDDLFEKKIRIRPQIKNTSSNNYYYFSKDFCVKNTEITNIRLTNTGSFIYDTTNGYCKNIGLLNPGDDKLFDFNEADFIGQKLSESDSGSIINEVKLYIQDYIDDSITKTIKAIISKPSVITAGGGTSYLSNTDKIADISSVAGKKSLANNNNFIGASVNTSGFSSYSKKVTNTGSEDKISSSYSGSLSIIPKGLVATSTGTSFSDFTSYNGLKDVFILKDKHFNIESSTILLSWSGSTTYIIEGGNLTIEENITLPNDVNIAFVVKGGGNIIIGSNVTKLEGTYINIGSNIIGDETGKQLVINGSMYGNMSDLVYNRYYINENGNGQIDVGVIVNFSSKIFKNTAPLTGKFIGDYMNSRKIAK